jgi:hypothetical protein
VLIDAKGFTGTKTRNLKALDDGRPLFKEPERSEYTHLKVPEELKKKRKPDPAWRVVEALTVLIENGVMSELEADMILERLES